MWVTETYTSVVWVCVFLHVHICMHAYECDWERETEREGGRGWEPGKWLRQAGDASLSAAAPTQVSSFMQRRREVNSCPTLSLLSNTELIGNASFNLICYRATCRCGNLLLLPCCYVYTVHERGTKIYGETVQAETSVSKNERDGPWISSAS